MTPATTCPVWGEIETPRPLRARNGHVTLTGWCLVPGEAVPPAVRLHTEAGWLPLSARISRADLASLHPGEKSAHDAGFIIEGNLPAGVHLVRFEARLPDGQWHCFKSLTLAVEPPPFATAIEFPVTTGVVTARVHVEGWALHTQQAVRELSLRYGHQEVPCELGRSRTDLPQSHPNSAHAAQAGFKSRTILAAGRGALRLKARLADGSTAIGKSPLTIEIDHDENHGPAIDLTAPRVPLGRPVPRAAPPAVTSSRPLNVLFVSHGNFTANSTLQIAALANELALAGHRCAVAVPQDVTTLAYHQSPRFLGMLHAEAVNSGGSFPDGRGPDVIHAWTTRESVRSTSLAVQAKFGGRIIVQLEDNEHEIRRQQLSGGAGSADLTEPIRGSEFLQTADGVTLIVGALAEFVPKTKPSITVWPAADARYFYAHHLQPEFRQALRIPPATIVLFYHGNVHATNAGEMRELYRSLILLNERGPQVLLIRAGTDQVDFLGDLAPQVAPHVLHLGPIHNHRHLPPLMALADIFVQPGVPDAFNDYRFPSKLPEFFAIGRPVVLPRTNLGTVVRHGEDAYVLDRADAAGIAAAVTELRGNPALREKLSRGALAFAAEHFSWRRSAESLEKFYLGLLPAP